jgi:23S rRNA (cytosine1962-C5)-methyltransferase
MGITVTHDIFTAKWQDYELLDCGDGNRLERWGDYIVVRPEPLALWPKSKGAVWNKAVAIYHRSNSGGGIWNFKEKLPSEWVINYKRMKFIVRPTGFKHMGLFQSRPVIGINLRLFLMKQAITKH